MSFVDEDPVWVDYMQYRDRQMADVDQGFGIMPRALTVGDAGLTWSNHLWNTDPDDRDNQALTVVNVNGISRQFREEDFDLTQNTLPVVTTIVRQGASNGVVSQTSPTASSTNTGTSQVTTVRLKTGDQVTGGVNSSVVWNW
jgi:hypothetical protein